ncbi:MAG: hypothetical protein HOO91_12210 [Bacteroidales bacterium]|nr:hypothetical protein [Bacteroidales bacterium]
MKRRSAVVEMYHEVVLCLVLVFNSMNGAVSYPVGIMFNVNNKNQNKLIKKRVLF